MKMSQSICFSRGFEKKKNLIPRGLDPSELDLGDACTSTTHAGLT